MKHTNEMMSRNWQPYLLQRSKKQSKMKQQMVEKHYQQEEANNLEEEYN